MTITLYQYPGAWGLPSVSPFCLKVETYLRMTKRPYATAVGDLTKSPKGKLPYVVDDGTTIGDSAFILEHLKRKHGDTLDAYLAPDELALGLLVRRTFEEHLYYVSLYDRWIEDPGWEEFSKILREMMSAPFRWLVPGMVRRDVMKTLHRQGVLRHTRDEIFALGRADLRALGAILGDKAFFLGPAATSIDATAYAFLASILKQPWNSPLTQTMEETANLVAYVDRMRKRFW